MKPLQHVGIFSYWWRKIIIKDNSWTWKEGHFSSGTGRRIVDHKEENEIKATALGLAVKDIHVVKGVNVYWIYF